MGARFVRLGIAGFKSFADATSIDILPGLTGVVGPNGCGKSNVAEALRWAMGESNARTLRGGEMDDVIFAGTANRPSRNLAEVSLNVESDEDGLPPPFAANAELQVMRRIERGAGSGYRVNGREARARDVQTLFADMASGARSTAMVSQGRVGMLVNARPEERRAVLEEAAGITGLHARRAEAETRLRAAELNLERADERKELLERQSSGLREQAKQAARYRDVMQAALEAEAGLLSLQRARAQAARQAAALLIHAANDALQAAAEESELARRTASAAHASLPALREVEGEARAQLERAKLAQEGVAAEAGRAKAELAAALQRRTQMERDLAHARTVLQESATAQSRLIAEAERLHSEAEAYPAMQEAAKGEADAAARALIEADQDAAVASGASAAASARGDALRQLSQQAEARLRRAQEHVATVVAERRRAAAQAIDNERLTQADAAMATAAEALETARTAQDRAEAARANAIPASAAARDAFSRLDAARLKLAAETTALTEILAVKDGEKWPAMVDRLQVPAGLEAALGAVLGEELAAAEDVAAARHWRSLPPIAPGELPGSRLDAAVEAPALLSRALGGIGLVSSARQGDAAQACLRPGQTLVSTEGAVWRWDGYTVRAGTPTTAAVRLRQRNRLSGLRLALADAERECDAARSARQAADKAERAAIDADSEARAGRRTAETEAERCRNTARALHAAAQQAAARVAAVDEQMQQLAPETRDATAAAESARSEVAALPDITALRAAADAARSAVATARNRDTAAHRALEALQRSEQARQLRLGTIGREREDRRLRASDLADRVTDLVARLVDAGVEYDRLGCAPAAAERLAGEASSAVTAAEAACQAATLARQLCETRADAAANSARSAEHAAFAAREALVRAEASADAATQSVLAAEARIAEREGALPPLPPRSADLTQAAEERARNRVQRLSRERDEMGPVNLRAEIEADAIRAEITVLGREREELGTAIAKLRGSIGHLNREGRERLTEVFQQVDRHFQTLFARMFGGGRAHLALVGSDDPLLAGLEIYAQPPGKKLAALSLLSGGEQALTALSLIFAVFRCNPAPLCVLDEVDAPLDDANVERLCALLTDMVDETGTRFLVVTHHQLTMARMDRLYGVTMQERGVSRLLSVDLTRAVGMIEAVAAE